MPRMHTYRIIKVLRQLVEKELTRETFGQGNHFIDENGVPIKPIYANVHRAARHCIGGAVIKVLGLQGYIDNRKGRGSSEYLAVMCSLADTLGAEGSAWEKTFVVQKFNNSHTFDEVQDLGKRTAARLQQRVLTYQMARQ